MNTSNGGEALNFIRDEFGEIGEKMSTGAGCLLEQEGRFEDSHKKPMGCFGEVQVNTTNGGEVLNAKRDDSGEVGKKMSTGAGCLLEWGGRFEDTNSKPMGCFGEVQMDATKGGDALKWKKNLNLLQIKSIREKR